MQEKRHGPEIAKAAVCMERNDRHFVVYRGTREALVAAGLAKPEHFPRGKRHLSWRYPRFGENWGIRRKNGNVYCLTKLKDRHGMVDAEVGAFRLAAAAEAQRDTAFQRFTSGVRFGIGPERQRPMSQRGWGDAESLGRLAVGNAAGGNHALLLDAQAMK